MKQIAAFMLTAMLSSAIHANTETAKEWRFNVYLDDSKVGYHHFRVENKDEHYVLASDARFDVKILFFTAYRYQHNNRETWRGGCLQDLESRTDDNGKSYKVEGRIRGKTFIVEAGDQVQRIAGCVKSFSYWDPSFLSAAKLLNAQTGEHVNIRVEDLGEDRVEVRGASVPARRYRLIARDQTIDLWYSPQREWLALESQTNGGRLAYRMQ